MAAIPSNTQSVPGSRVQELELEVRRLELQVRDLKNQLYGKKSERYAPGEGPKNMELFADPVAAPMASPVNTAPRGSKKTAIPKGPKPLDPALPRELVKVDDPALQDLFCPVTGRVMQIGFVERLEVLRRKPAVWFVQALERNVFVSPAKSAPVYSEWPSDVLPRSRVHTSVMAFIAAQHFCEHQPYFRIEKALERVGIDLPRVCQVSLMNQLDERMKPLVDAIQKEVLASGYVQMDATPIDMCDPARPGVVREATLWAYRAVEGAVWFQFQLSKSPTHPQAVLARSNYKGLLQTDGASGFAKLGLEGQVTHLGCFAHCRRYFFKAVKAGDPQAQIYLDDLNRLFRLERLAVHFALTPENREQLRNKYSLPLFQRLVSRAEVDTLKVPPTTNLGEAFHYLLAQKLSLERCVTNAHARLSNNLVENAVRPLKLGAKNWLQIGHPNAGPRLAHLFTLVENCRQEGIDPETFLIDVIARLPDHPMKRIDELLPRQWKLARPRPAGAQVAVA
jgi:hypothetical protein